MPAEVPAVTVDTFITTVTSLITAAIGWMGSVVDMIMSTPLFLVPLIVFFFIGGAIGLVRRCI